MKDNCALKPLLIKFPPSIASLSHVSGHYVEDPYVISQKSKSDTTQQ